MAKARSAAQRAALRKAQLASARKRRKNKKPATKSKRYRGKYSNNKTTNRLWHAGSAGAFLLGTAIAYSAVKRGHGTIRGGRRNPHIRRR